MTKPRRFRSRTLLPRRTIAAVAIATASCSASHQTADQLPTQHEQSANSSAVFAFTTDTQLSMVRGGVVVATAEAPALPEGAVVTESGRFAATATFQGPIVTVGLTPGSARTIPVAVPQVFADRGDTIAWWQQPNQLVSLDLSQPAEPVSTPIELPGGNTQNTRMISFADGIAVFARPGKPDGREDLFRMDRDHSFHPIGSSPEIAHPIQTTTPSPDGKSFAYEVFGRSACPQNGIDLIDARTGAVSTPDMPGSTGDIASMRRTWWDSDGLLHMSMAIRPCQTDHVTDTMTTWKLDHNKWIHDDPDNVLESRQLGEHQIAAVTTTQFTRPHGTLWLQTGADREHLADNVTYLATPSRLVLNDS